LPLGLVFWQTPTQVFRDFYNGRRTAPIKVDLMRARKKGLIEGNTLEELMDAAVNQDVITEEQANQLSEYDQLAMDIINVDAFSEEELKTIR